MAAVRPRAEHWLVPSLVIATTLVILFSACTEPAPPPLIPAHANTPEPATIDPSPTPIPTPTLTEPNQPPIITKLETSTQSELRIWMTIVIECTAEDPDENQLTYSWSTTGGKIQGEGNKIGWTAPGVAGEYTVTVNVNDSRGGEAEESISLNVLCCGN